MTKPFYDKVTDARTRIDEQRKADAATVKQMVEALRPERDAKWAVDNSGNVKLGDHHVCQFTVRQRVKLRCW